MCSALVSAACLARILPLSAQQTTGESPIAQCLKDEGPNARWYQVARHWTADSTRTWSNDSLRQVLLALAKADQAVRPAGSVPDSGDQVWKRIAAQDSANAAVLREIVARYGWPGKRLVGIEGANAAWLIAQHNASLQREALRLMREMPGDVSPMDLAYLEDRVLSGDGKPQRYGTQLRPARNGVAELFPIDDLEHVDERRAEAGLWPLGAYICVLQRTNGLKVKDPRASGAASRDSLGTAVELRPGRQMPEAPRLRSGASAYVFYSVQNGAVRPSGLVWRSVIVDRSVPRGRLTLVQRWQFPQGTTTDTSVLYLDTMEPISFHGEQQDKSYRLEFTRGRVRGTRRDADGTTHDVDVQRPTPFYNEVVDEIFAAAQPLTAGYAYTYVAYSPGEDPRPLTVRVVGSERLTLSGGDSVDTWIVEQRGIQQLVVRWWFAKATHEELLMRVVSPDGAEYGFLPLRLGKLPDARQ